MLGYPVYLAISVRARGDEAYDQLPFATPRLKIRAGPISVYFRKPNPREQAQLSSLARERAEFPDWVSWTIHKPRVPCPVAPVAADDPLKLNLLLRMLFFGAAPLDQVDPALLDVLTGVYAPEANALRAER